MRLILTGLLVGLKRSAAPFLLLFAAMLCWSGVLAPFAREEEQPAPVRIGVLDEEPGGVFPIASLAAAKAAGTGGRAEDSRARRPAGGLRRRFNSAARLLAGDYGRGKPLPRAAPVCGLPARGALGRRSRPLGARTIETAQRQIAGMVPVLRAAGLDGGELEAALMRADLSLLDPLPQPRGTAASGPALGNRCAEPGTLSAVQRRNDPDECGRLPFLGRLFGSEPLRPVCAASLPLHLCPAAGSASLGRTLAAGRGASQRRLSGAARLCRPLAFLRGAASSDRLSSGSRGLRRRFGGPDPRAGAFRRRALSGGAASSRPFPSRGLASAHSSARRARRACFGAGEGAGRLLLAAGFFAAAALVSGLLWNRERRNPW